MSPVIHSQTPAVTKGSRKRKRVARLDGIIEAFDVKPKDYEAAWNDLKARITEAYTPGHVPTVGLCIYCDLQAIGLRF
jgi:hypothetical protein